LKKAKGILGERPPVLYGPRDGKPDDLKLIWGVAEKLEKKLHELGIYHFDQIANWTSKDLAWFESHLGEFATRPERDKWVEQAQKLAAGWRPDQKIGQKPAGYGEGKKPEVLAKAPGGKLDDLKLIWGVGPKLEEKLHSLGIYQFAQIAKWNHENTVWVENQLGEFADRVERDEWVSQAKKLATGWRPDNSVGDKPKG
jgi:predicted flap endonuclease-1-like 5' DNA nuclease